MALRGRDREAGRYRDVYSDIRALKTPKAAIFDTAIIVTYIKNDSINMYPLSPKKISKKNKNVASG